jgi:hypothetical protein
MQAVAQCSLVEIYCYGETWCVHVFCWWRQKVSPEQRWCSTRLHGVGNETVVFMRMLVITRCRKFPSVMHVIHRELWSRCVSCLCVVCKGKLSVSCCLSLIWEMYKQRVCMSLGVWVWPVAVDRCVGERMSMKFRVTVCLPCWSCPPTFFPRLLCHQVCPPALLSLICLAALPAYCACLPCLPALSCLTLCVLSAVTCLYAPPLPGYVSCMSDPTPFAYYCAGHLGGELPREI